MQRMPSKDKGSLLKITVANQRPTIQMLDELFRDLIRKRDKVCCKCGKATQLQVAHIYSRRHFSVRWDADNAMLLCLHHHLFWAHKDPLAFTEWIKERLGEEKYNALRLRAAGVKQIDRAGVKLYLLQRLKNEKT